MEDLKAQNEALQKEAQALDEMATKLDVTTMELKYKVLPKKQAQLNSLKKKYGDLLKK